VLRVLASAAGRLVISAVLATAAGLTACGGKDGPAAPQPPAQPLSAQSPVSAATPPATPAEYRGPIRAYRGHVLRQLARMAVNVAVLRRAIAAGDAAGARAAWRAANGRYQTIGAAYGAFGELDRAVSGSPAGLPRGIRDPHFTGLHRVELALFGRRSLADAAAPADALARALARMRARVPHLEIDPLEYSLRAHEVLEDTLHLQLTGQASPWSGAAYDAVAANVAGTREVLRTLTPMIDARSRAARRQAQRSLSGVASALGELRRRHGGAYPTLNATPRRERELVAARVAAAAESLAAIPELIDPRPPLPVRSAFGKDPS
jgi:iron uptake system EfeUOB component EfeO/EfeM